MTQTLAVDVNADGLYTLSVPAEFEANGPFTVELHNHGEASHVYLNLDDRLSEVARIEATNHYLKEHEQRRVDVATHDPSTWPDETLRGSLKVVVAHGQETRYVSVVLERAAQTTTEVEVAPELSSPTVTEQSTESTPLLRALPVVVAGSIAVLLAVGALFTDGGTQLLLGIGAVVAAAACGVAAYLLFE